MNAIEIKNLCKKYKDFSLDNLNLTLPGGCIMGLIGENGAGKSTTIKLILNILKKDEGIITVLGKDSTKLNKEDIGIVFDEVGVSECLNAKKINKVMKCIYKNWQEDVFFDFLDKFSLPKDKYFKDFSRGMKMKMGIAIAMSHNAKLLILDEATSGLDPVVRDEVIEIFSEFTRDENHSVLISSHIVSDLEKICDYIAFIHKGKLMLCEEKDRLYEEYCIIRCSSDELSNINPSAIIGKRENKYGVEVIVKKEKISSEINVSPIDIEQLFIFMCNSKR